MKRTIYETDLYGITDPDLSLGRSLEEVAGAMLAHGIRVIQYRQKNREGRAMLEDCLLLRRLTSKAGALLIVNDYVDLALLSQADGVHLGQTDLPARPVRELMGQQAIIGVSTHNPQEARQARLDGADYLGVGAIFPTQTKQDGPEPVGLQYIDYVAANIDLPFVVIGGIKAHNISLAAAHGARCFAVISGIVSAPDMGAAIAELRASLKNA